MHIMALTTSSWLINWAGWSTVRVTICGIVESICETSTQIKQLITVMFTSILFLKNIESLRLPTLETPGALGENKLALNNNKHAPSEIWMIPAR